MTDFQTLEVARDKQVTSKIFLRASLASVLTLLNISCTTHTSVLPLADGTNLIIIHASSETSAYESAISEAQSYCQNRGKQFVVLDRKLNYEGMEKSEKAIIDTLGVFTGINVNTSNGEDDYKLEISFKCQ
ncbi:MAG: hypothetical protein ACXWT3_05255 [Methylococcaceae bacterium]